MADRLTPDERSVLMSKIRGTGTKPEVYLRKLLFSDGLRYRVNVSYIPGHPDIFLRRFNAAIFVNGCFWHHHPGCKGATTPKSNTDYWLAKFDRNRRRDAEVTAELAAQGVRQLVVWECTLRQMNRDAGREAAELERIEAFIRGDEKRLEL